MLKIVMMIRHWRRYSCVRFAAVAGLAGAAGAAAVGVVAVET